MCKNRNDDDSKRRALVYLDLLGFGSAIKADTEAAADTLEDYYVALMTAVEDSKLHPPASYSTKEMRNIAERSSITSFQYFMPGSDSVFIISDAPSALVF